MAIRFEEKAQIENVIRASAFQVRLAYNFLL
ncbi:unnamed protein product [Dibothriocephalus latus]|uniref:Uncharacterized protein n=1 Tax=Dibothriocephalus latus TaxID=60516 RepID=A0A3P7MDP5_DIBLA|nr:unnamed protein product [Dibothriocephalus latus]